MYNIPHLKDKNIELDGIAYSLSDIASEYIDVEIRKNIIDNAEMTYEVLEYLLNRDTQVEDEIIIYVVNKVGNGDSSFKIPMRTEGSRIETPLELAVAKRRSDKVIMALVKSSKTDDKQSIVTRFLRKAIGLVFPNKVLDTLEDGANRYIEAEGIRDEVNSRITEHTEPIHKEQPMVSMVVEPNSSK